MFVRRFYAYMTAIVCALVFIFGCIALRYSAYARLQNIQGERYFYLYSASSQARIKKEVSLLECFSVKGESVHFTLTANGEEKAMEIAKDYGAQMLFFEETNGSVSYYFHTSKFPGGIFVNGALVNLHIAIGEGRCAVGYPIIFGGF